MINYHPRLYWLCLILIFSYSCTPEIQKEKIVSPPEIHEEEEMDKQSRMDLAMEQEFEMTKDPALGRIPRERLFELKQEMLRTRDQGQQRSAIPGVDWVERGPNNVSGRTREILIDAADPTGNTIYAGSVGGGLWKCENALSNNPTWTSINDFFENLAVCAIAQDPNDSDILYFGTGEGYYNGDAIAGIGLWKSIDGGANWDYLVSTANNTFNHAQQIIINDAGTVFVATRAGGVQESLDGGATWTRVLGSGASAITNRVADLEMAANGDLYAAMGIRSQDGIYKSTDDGATWTQLTLGLPSNGYERIELACAPSNANIVYALFQDRNDFSCKGIYKTTNGGTSWVEKNNPGASGMNNFARNQAWYDLIAAVDPNDSERIFIGGVDLLVSNNGGDSWAQISQWFGGGFQYVHADQHAITFLDGNSDIAFFGNDGGVFATTNASAFFPTIDFISDGYNVTQFYSCAIHPGAGEDYFLAGAQDNGTQRFQSSGLNNTTTATGGDGGFCHIDQNQPQVQITTYVYNRYRISTNGGNSFSDRSFNDNGRFINPFDYDDLGNKLYGANFGGSYLRWNNPATGGNNHDVVTVSAFNSSTVTHVAVSPNIENRVYFGLGNGNLVLVDAADVGMSRSGVVIRNGTGYLSGVAIERGNEDHILVTYSNYGVNSIFETMDGGDSWSSVEGNLPDIPVRWVIFNPNNTDQALIATEVGVWSTEDLNGSLTQWAPSNSGLANVRVDMLKTRISDNVVIAATHGRGLFSTERFSDLYVGFRNDRTIINEFSNTGAEGDCELHYQDLAIPISVNRLPLAGEPIKLYFNVVDTSSATLAEDYTLFTDSLQFTASDTILTKYVTTRIFDDAINEAINEELVLKMTMEGMAKVLDTVHAVVITDNDVSPIDVLGDYTEQIGTGTTTIRNGSPLQGYWHDAKSQYLYKVGELLDKGFTKDSLIEIAFDVSSIGSTQSYNDFKISMKNTSINTLEDTDFSTGFVEVYSGDYDPVLGWNTFTLAVPFAWDGESNLLIQTCFNNSSYTNDDLVYGTETNFISSRTSYADGGVGCDLDIANLTSAVRPNIQLRQLQNASISNQVDHKTSFVKENETAHFYDDDGSIMLSIKNLEGGDLSCLDVQIDHYGIGLTMPDWLDGAAHSDKTFLVVTENEEAYELTLYFTEEELNIWNDPNSLSFLKTLGSVMSHDGSSYEVVDPAEVMIENFGPENHYAFTTTFNASFGFTLTDAEPIALPLSLLSLKADRSGLSNTITWQTTQEENVDYMELQRSFDGQAFLPIEQINARNNVLATNTYEYLDLDLQRKSIDYYYRLKIVDLDASYQYSDIVSVFVEDSKGQSKVYPNPFTETLRIEPVEGQTVKTVLIHDATGKKIRALPWDNQPLDLNDLTPGVFWLTLTYENEQSEIHRIVKTK